MAPSKKKAPEFPEGEHPQRRFLFKKKRAGVELSREQVSAIKAGRKKLRKEMRARGLKSKRDFEATAASLGLYFDKARGLWAWLWRHGLGLLLGAFLLMLLVLFILSLVQYMRGRFTVHLSDEMFKEGFTLSETADFANPTTVLFAVPAEDVPCISVAQIGPEVDMIDGEHNENYFAYTFYIRNEGENTVDYKWELSINQETQNLSSATWVALYEDGNLILYAEENKETGDIEALPPFYDDTRGYMAVPLLEQDNPDQLEVVATQGRFTYYRILPEAFASENVVTRREMQEVDPMEAHKYTVVMWIEGDDPDCTDDLIDGTMGVQMDFRLTHEEQEEEEGHGFGVRWKKFWDRVRDNMDFV
ncbi:MAG: hypothetical protein IKU72_02515 [Oscillospiraceae bacterium]|nr:hypothetical protein [Oscillospiraceae bacterium]